MNATKAFSIIIATFVVFFLCSPVNAQESSGCVQFSSNEIKLNSEIKICSDQNSDWLDKGIFKSIKKAEFTLYSRNFFVHNKSASVLLSFDFICLGKNNIEEYVFDVGNPEIDQLQLCLVSNDSIVYISKVLGDVFPFNDRYLDAKTFAIPLTLTPGVEYTAYLGLSKKHRIITTPISLFKKSTWLDQQRRQNFKHGILFGVFGVLIILSIAFFFVARNTMYLYYGCYIATIILMLMGIHGYSYKYLFPNSPYIQFHYITLDHILGLMFLTLYAFRFLEIEEKFKKLKSLKKVYMALYGVALVGVIIQIDILFPLLGRIFGTLFFVVQISNLLFLIFFPLWYYIRYKNKGGLIFFISYLFVGLSLIYVNVSFIVESMYYIPISTSLPIASFFEIFVLSFYMILSYREIENQKLSMENKLNKALLENQVSFFKGQEAEKNKTARILHDDIGSSIVLLRMQLESANARDPGLKLDKAKSDLLNLSKQIRDLSHDLLPISLQEYGINVGLLELFKRAEGSIQIHFSDIDFTNLSKEDSLQIYRIFQELLKNTLTHANAENIYIQTFSEDGTTIIIYEDDGKGVDMTNLQTGLGLNNIRTRCKLIDANLRLESSVGGGFAAYIELPC